LADGKVRPAETVHKDDGMIKECFRVKLGSRVAALCAAMTVATLLVGSADVTAQVSYVTIGPVATPSPEASVSVDSPLTCSDLDPNVPNRAFVKVGTQVNVDALATATGHCEVWYQQTYWWSEYRYFAYIHWSNTPPGGSTSWAHFAGPWPPPAIDPTQFDTKNPGTGTGTQTFWLNTEGKYTLEFESQLGTTSCSLPGYSDSPRTSVELNAVKCRPLFSSYGHFAADTNPIVIYLPSGSTWDAAEAALEYAKDSWNAQMPSNAQYSVARGTCNGGAGCVQVAESGTQSFCGYASTTSNSNLITGNAVLTLRGDWRTWSPASLKRTFAHELGHFRGLDNYDSSTGSPACAINDAVMQAGFDCGPNEAPMTDVKPSDSRPADSTVYNGNTSVYCGF
jgi:hypothetical protein